MSAVANTLRAARDLYAAAPSHASWSWEIAPNTVCVHFAIGDAAPTATAALDAMAVMRDAAGTYCIAHWNATHSTEEVLAAFDKAIAIAEEQS